jgi:pimeloyl-ACP methyl ester carboxylesterase
MAHEMGCHPPSTMLARSALAVLAVAVATLAVVASPAAANVTPPVSVEFMSSYAAPETPVSLDKVGVIKVGQPTARNVLVLEPGTSAAGAYFVPFAKWVAETLPGWQVWAVVRRESLLEDQSELNLAKEGKATAEEVFNYYLGWITNPAIEHHIHPILEANYAKKWGMKVAVEDLHRVIEAAHELGGQVVLGGHSLGGSVVTAYATWDFGGQPGADGLSGLVYDDGGSGPEAVSEEKANEELTALNGKFSPWLTFGGIPSPEAGLFAVTGAVGTQLEPNGPSLAESYPLLPANLKPPKPPCSSATNEAQFGYSLNVATSPESLVAAQAHLGHLVTPAEGEGECTWSSEGALTPIHRYAEMFYGEGLIGEDGSEWYFPERLTIDTGAVADGNENDAQKVLELEATEGHSLPKSLKILAIDSELDKKLIVPRATLIAAEVLAEQSGIPKENLTLIDAEETYAHNDPAGAYPQNVFFEAMIPYLQGIATEKLEFKNSELSGTFTLKGLQDQMLTLPEGSTFNGDAEVSPETGAGSIAGNIFVPPFTAPVKLFRFFPGSLGITLSQVGALEGTLTRSETIPGDETITLPLELNLGVTSVGLLGIKIPTHCTTAEPVSLKLTQNLTLEELRTKGLQFAGTTSLPRFRCEGGIAPSLFSFLLSVLVSGPENTYAIDVAAPRG